MGYHYALASGLNKEIAEAIRDHYKPLGPTDNIPQGMAAMLAIADKMDSIVGLMIAGEAPTGSGDPYALRRMALGIIRIVLEKNLRIELIKLIDYMNDFHQNMVAQGVLNTLSEGKDPQGIANMYDNLTDEVYHGMILGKIEKNKFLVVSLLKERARYYFKDKYDISLINAVLDFENQDDLVITKFKLDAFKDLLSNIQGQELVTNYKRANNILGNQQVEGQINIALLALKEEQELSNELNKIIPIINNEIQKNNFSQALQSLANLNTPIKNFFDNVLVNDPDPKIANNRLLLLFEVKKLFDKIAKFDQL
jgi:glycyl-tRNA synthetase beta chain